MHDPDRIRGFIDPLGSVCKNCSLAEAKQDRWIDSATLVTIKLCLGRYDDVDKFLYILASLFHYTT